MQSRKRFFLSLSTLLILGGIGIVVSMRISENRDITPKESTASSTSVTASLNIFPDDDNYELKGYGVNMRVAEENIVKAVSKQDLDLYNQLVEAYREFGFSYIRFPNGEEIRHYNWLHPKDSYMPYGRKENWDFASVEEMLDFAEEVDSEVLFEMSVLGLLPSEGGYDESLRKHRYGGGDEYTYNDVYVMFSEEEIRDFVRKYTVQRKNNGQSYISSYELGNEEWLLVNETLNRGIYPQEYLNAALKVAQIIRQETNHDPDIKIVGVSGPKDGVWASSLYNEMDTSNIDYVNLHIYQPFMRDFSGGESLYNFPSDKPVIDLYESKFAKESNYSKPAITEWNLLCFGDYETKHPNTLKHEHLLYTVGSTIELMKSDIPFSFYHCFRFIDDLECGLFDDVSSDDYSAPGRGFTIVERFFGKTNVKSDLVSPNYLAGGIVDVDKYALWSQSSRDGDIVKTFIMNRNPDEDIPIEILVDGYDKIRYRTIVINAEEFSSEDDNVITAMEDAKQIHDGKLRLNIPAKGLVILEIDLTNNVFCLSENDCSSSDVCRFGICDADTTCTGFFEGYIFDSTNKVCEKKYVLACTNPFQYLTLKDCQVDNREYMRIDCSKADIVGGENGNSDKFVTVADFSYVLIQFNSAKKYKETNKSALKADIWGPQQKADGYVNAYDISLVINPDCFDSERKRPL